MLTPSSSCFVAVAVAVGLRGLVLYLPLEGNVSTPCPFRLPNVPSGYKGCVAFRTTPPPLTDPPFLVLA